MSQDQGFRPPQRVRPLSICVVRRADGHILAVPGYDEVKARSFYRPLGGEIEFMETAEAASRRELIEEIGAELAEMRLLGIFENIFTYRGTSGHELVWVFDGDFADRSLYQRESIACLEGDAGFEAHWVPLSMFAPGGPALYPDGLLDLLSGPIT